MERKVLTWERLAEKISEMSPEERKESVKVWGEERPLCDDVCLTKEDEDLCYDENWPEDGCYVRSEFDKDSNISIALEAGKYCLYV